ncbi:MAG: hypothetical protein KC800_26185 [Candidatus Eremiobacteraeota bacterium]|nr:hypothetical protein [Candidatus Eremiobacteraeota bacterium]
MKRFFNLTYLLLILLTGWAWAQDNEAYTRVLDKLTSVNHFAHRPILFIIGFDTSKSMSVEFDRSKKLTQTILSRYAAPGDHIFIFGFADKPSVLEATSSPTALTADNPDKQLAGINESLLSLPRSSAKGTVFGRAKLFSLEKAQEFGKDKNVVVLLFSDNNSEIEMGTDERDRLKQLESSVAARSETVPLYSQGVSHLWLTLYTNNFPNQAHLVDPDGTQNSDNPRLAWAARRVGSQTLQFISPASNRVETDSLTVAVQFLGSSEPASANLSVDGKDTLKTTFQDGVASWDLPNLQPGSHLLFAQAVMADGKIRSAEMEVLVATPAPVVTPSVTPTPPRPTPTPSATPEEEPKESGSPPIIPFILLCIAAAVVYFLSNKPIKVRVIGPDSEESFLIPKGKSVRVGGTARVESDLVFKSEGLGQSIASVRCMPFGKAKVFCNEEVREGAVEVETDEGYTVGQTGEPLLTSATVTHTDERGRKKVFTLVKEDGSGPGAEEEHFGSSGGEEAGDSGSDWRA